MDERQWIHAIQRGEKQYLQDIVEKYYDDVFRFCAFQTGSREDAYDLTQDTFLKFIRYVEGYHYRNLKGYLLTISMNLCRDHMTKKGRREERESSFEQSGFGREDFSYEGSGSFKKYRTFDESAVGMEIAVGMETAAGLGASPEARLVEKDIHDRLMAVLSLLPPVQREVLLLHYLQDMKYREIAKLTGVPVATVKSRVKQGTDKLRGLLRREDFLDV